MKALRVQFVVKCCLVLKRNDASVRFTYLFYFLFIELFTVQVVVGYKQTSLRQCLSNGGYRGVSSGNMRIKDNLILLYTIYDRPMEPYKVYSLISKSAL